MAVGEGPLDSPTCIYFSRVDADHLGGGERNAIVRMQMWNPQTNNGSAVECAAIVPSTRNISTVIPALNQDFKCSSGTCHSVRMSSTCRSSTPLRDIGIGMSVGGIGLLLVTVGMILVISKVVAQG